MFTDVFNLPYVSDEIALSGAPFLILAVLAVTVIGGAGYVLGRRKSRVRD